jgi:protein XRP2
MVPDIFGIREFRQSTQAADLLAAAVPGLGVAHPDVFRGAPWPMAQFPPKDKDAFGAFIARHPYDDANVRGDVAAAFAALDARAKEAAGGGGGGGAASSSPIRLTMGFCWGALMALQANGDAELGVSASACPHPTFFGREAEMGKNLRGPVLLLPAKGDPAEAVVAAAQAAGLPFAQQCRVRRFDDQVHGFMAARGDYGDEAVRQAAGEGVGEVAAFFAGVVSGGGGGGGGGGGSA